MVNNLKKFQRGLTIVEVVIASALILVAVVSLIGVHTFYLKSALENTDTVKSAYLLEESLEAVRYLRDASWTRNIATLSSGTDYGLVLSGSTWQASTIDTTVDDFQRTFSISSVYRDANGDITSSGGTLDTNTKMVVARVSWSANGTTMEKTLSTYITNLWSN